MTTTGASPGPSWPTLLDGGEGVKLEQQLLVTETGTEVLDEFPFEDALS